VNVYVSFDDAACYISNNIHIFSVVVFCNGKYIYTAHPRAGDTLQYMRCIEEAFLSGLLSFKEPKAVD
jgi:hypothetical protein